MENLQKEQLLNKKEKNTPNELLSKIKSNKNGDKDSKINSKRMNIHSTDFISKIELTEEERNLRQNYLKKLTTKEVIYRSIYLGRRAYALKLYKFILNIIYDIINFNITKYKSNAINSITSKNLDEFTKSVVYHVVLLLLSKILTLLDDRIYKYISKDADTKNILLENLLYNKDIEFFDLFKTGELTNKVQLYKNYPLFNIIDTFQKICLYGFKIFYFGYYLYRDFFEMSLTYALVMIIQTILEPFLYNPVVNKNILEKFNLKNNYINDILSNIRLIKSFGTENKELHRVDNVIKKIQDKGFLKKLLDVIYNQLFHINEIINFYVCGKKTIIGKMDYGELLIFQGYSSEFKNSMSNLRKTFKSIKEGINTWAKFLEIYDIEQKIISKKNIIPKEEEEVEIKNSNKKKEKGLGIIFENVTFSYPTKKNIKIYDNFNLNIEPGKTIAIVGKSGSGKTTLAHLILRFYDVNKGNILINGINIKDIDLSWLRGNIGIVSQEPILTSGTIKENILYGVDNYTDEKFIEVCKLTNVYPFVTNKNLFPNGFETAVGERGIKVSTGQKQRIAIARALMKDAKILIFDEATSALDSENEAKVQEAINNVINQNRITTIIIAHRLSTVKDAKTIYVINNGKIVEYGTHHELVLKNGEYKKLIQKQLID